MTYRLVLLRSAQSDLHDLVTNYLTPKFGAQVAREKYTTMRRSVDLLKENPRLGRLVPELEDTGFEHFRQLIVEDLNKIIYQIDDEKQTVYVHIFCSTRQDFETLLRKRLLRSAR